jgi:uncharacterized protein YyaL (SSP411 family)
MMWLIGWQSAAAVEWQEWSAGVWQRAQAEDKLVLLHVGAIWCHWCHVMEHETYADPAIEERLARSFVAVRVDQDAQPDLSQRYEDWGWPATVLFAPDGTELAKLRGYVPPEKMAVLLDAFLADPTPGPSAIPEPAPTDAGTSLLVLQRDALQTRWSSIWDEEQGGWGRITKALDGPSFELAFSLRTEPHLSRALRTATLQRQLVDPVWGGAYQYSHGGVWTNPHFEKIVPTQADNLRAFALAWAQRHEQADQQAALAIFSYVEDFLWAEGYQTSQDADVVPGEHAEDYFALDDAGRRARGLPRLDPNRYARDNGLMISALADASGWLGEEELLQAAIRTAQWALAHRALPGGGFLHGEQDRGGPWLSDTLAMAEGFAALHTATADPAWLQRASDALDFVDETFRTEKGYRSSAQDEGIPGLPPLRHREENARLARLAAQLARSTGETRHQEVAEHAMALCAGLAQDGPAAPVLLADLALRVEPLHIVVVGPRSHPDARALYDAARALPLVHRWLEWREEARAEEIGSRFPDEGGVAVRFPQRAEARAEEIGSRFPDEGGVVGRQASKHSFPERAEARDLPPVDRPTAFVCGDGTCSPPLTDPGTLAKVIR